MDNQKFKPGRLWDNHLIRTLVYIINKVILRDVALTLSQLYDKNPMDFIEKNKHGPYGPT